jgi:hypothetical protein
VDQLRAVGNAAGTVASDPNKYLTRRLWMPLAAAVSITGYFAVLTKAAFLSYFNPDACMNIYRSWSFPASWLVKANLLFFLNSDFYRPMGSVWYLGIFGLAGFNPVPFIVLNLLVLAANIWLTYSVCRRLTGSREAGALAALLIAYHGGFAPLYFDLGYTYDVLCYFFYFSALLFYIRIRSQGRALNWRQSIACSVLYICALNAKEMAVTLPAVLFIYEWLYQRTSLRNLWRWLVADGRAVLVIGVMTVMFTIGRSVGSGLLTIPAYQPVFSWTSFMATSRSFFQQLFFRTAPVSSVVVVLIWLILFAIAWTTKSRALKFAWLFLMLTVIPVAFIQPRGAAQYYIPYFGWVLYAAAALVEGAKRLLARLPRAARFSSLRATVLFLGVGTAMSFLNARIGWVNVTTVSQEGELSRSVVEQIHHLHPALRPGSKILIRDDPFDQPHQMLFLIRLSYGDNSLVVGSAKFMQPAPSDAQIAAYDYVFDYRMGRIFASSERRPSGPEPAIAIEWGHPSLYHSDWTRITRRHPARTGEVVISMALDLGDTLPPVPHDRPFPSTPYLDVASPVEVRVGGQPAEVLLKIGWPEMMNRYRVDFRIPGNVRRGMAAVEVTCRGATGPPTAIEVE